MPCASVASAGRTFRTYLLSECPYVCLCAGLSGLVASECASTCLIGLFLSLFVSLSRSGSASVAAVGKVVTSIYNIEPNS